MGYRLRGQNMSIGNENDRGADGTKGMLRRSFLELSGATALLASASLPLSAARIAIDWPYGGS